MMNLEIISNFSKQSDPFQQKAVLEYFESFKSNPDGWKICAETLTVCTIKDESAIFFCLQVIDDYIRFRYQSDNEENRKTLNLLILSFFDKDLFTSNYLQNKYASLVNSIFLIDFPNQKWNSFFTDFLNRCNGQNKCDLFLRILIQINFDIADREIPRTTKEMQRNTLIKDIMRETCLMDLAQFWFNIINTYRDSSPSTVCLCLDTIGSYVSWIDINLITNDSIMSNLFSLFLDNSFRCSVTDCFNAILRKGMDPFAKTQIIENFINIEYIKKTLADIFTNTNSSNLQFVEKFSSLINTIGIELIEAFKKLKSKINNLQNDNANEQHALNLISVAIESKFPLLCQFLSYKDYSVCFKIHSFARDYIQWIKNTIKDSERSNISTDEKTVILLSIIIEKSKWPLDLFNFDEEFFDEFRKSTKVLFDNLILLNSNTVLNFVCEKVIPPTLMNWKTNSLTFPEVEVALYYFYLIGENMNLINDQKRIENLVHLLVTSSISSFPHIVTQSFYFDLIFRYEKFFNTNLNYLSSEIIVSFLDERGLRNSNIQIRCKVCKLFKKFVKSYVKSKSNCQDKQQHFTEDILKRLQDFVNIEIAFDSCDELVEAGLEQLVNSNYIIKKESVDFPYPITTTDQLQIYETATFLIISNPYFEIPRKRELLKNLLESIWQRYNKLNEEVESILSIINQNGFLDSLNKNNLLEKRLMTVLHMSHCINIISATSKSFSNVNTVKSIGVQNLYLQSFDLFIKAINADSHHILQSSIRLFLHRLIVCLNEEDIVPLLPNSIQTLFLSTPDISSKSLQELVPLFCQIVPKYKHSWIFQRDIFPFLAQIFSPLVSIFFKLIISTNIENDKLSLQKSYYAFLHILFSNNLMPSFFDSETHLVEQILGSLIEGSVNFPDSSTQRMCFQILTKILEIYGNDMTLFEKQNRMINSLFVQFTYKSLVLACLVGATKNVDDYHTTQEALICLRKLNSLLGDEMCTFLRLQVAPKHFSSVANVDDLMTLILLSDLKSSKKSIKQALLQFKLSDTTANTNS